MEVINQGFPITTICEKANIDFSQLKDGDIEITDEQMETVWVEITKIVRNDEFGFLIGSKINLEGLGLFGMIIQNSKTIEEAFENAQHYVRLITDLITIKYTRKPVYFMVEVIPDINKAIQYPARSKQICLMALAIIVRTYKSLIFKKITPNKIVIPSTQNPDMIPTPYYGIHIERTPNFQYFLEDTTEFLDDKILAANYQVLATLISFANSSLQQHKSVWKSKVERILVANYSGVFLTLDEVAVKLNVSIRSLQRKLKNENISFSDIKDKVRLELAKYYLINNKNLKYTANYLGFSNPSSFSVAFKKWTGKTVTEFILERENQS